MKNVIRIDKQSLKFFFRIFIDFRDLFFYSPCISPSEGKKAILIFNWRDTKHSFAGGAEVYIQELAKRWVMQGHSVTLFCGSDGKSKRNESLDGVEILRRGGFYFVYIWAFLYYLVNFRGKYDVLIDCENGIPFFTPLFSRLPKFLVIHHVHQEVFTKSLKPPFSWLASFLEGKLMPLVYRKVQMVTVSPSSKADILKHNLTKSDPVIIYNGIDHIRYREGEKAKHPLILYVGRLQSYKSLPTLLRSVKDIVKKVPTAKIVIGGQGEERRKLQKLVKSLGIQEYVTFTGYLSEEEKIKLLQQAWIFINPSLREGWGITTIEANACGTPVIASRVAGLQDAIKHKQTGLLVPYADSNAFTTSAVELLTNASLRQQLADEAIIWSRSFNWDTSAQQFEQLILQLSSAVHVNPRRSFRLSYYVEKITSYLF